MNFLKKGPELKLSEIRVPGFLQDIYYDLKERHLLPIAAILIVAIIAVPIVLGGSSGSDPEGGESAVPSATQSTAVAGSGQLVAKSAPGLRDYRRRLKHLEAKDPFEQQYTGSGSTSSSGEGESGGSSSSPSSSESSSPGEIPFSPESAGEHTSVPGELKYYSYAIDVRVSAGGDSNVGKKATERHNLPELTMLPSRETPAIIYMGSTRDGKKALMVVSSNVDAIFGDAKCVLGSETCEMIAMEPNFPETFVYGGNGRTYKIELLKIHLVATDKLNRAPLGKPQKKQKKGNSG